MTYYSVTILKKYSDAHNTNEFLLKNMPNQNLESSGVTMCIVVKYIPVSVTFIYVFPINQNISCWKSWCPKSCWRKCIPSCGHRSWILYVSGREGLLTESIQMFSYINTCMKHRGFRWWWIHGLVSKLLRSWRKYVLCPYLWVM